MRKKSLLLILVLFLVGTTYAQDKAIKVNSFGDNWYIQGQIGVGYTKGGLDFKDLLSPAFAVSLGKDFSPYVGARLQLNGIQGKAGWSYNQLTKQKEDFDWNQIGLGLDGMFNISNIIAGYRSERKIDIIGIVGSGIMFTNDYSGSELIKENDGHAKYVYGRLGVAANLHLNEKFDVNFEFNANQLPDSYNRKNGSDNDAHFNTLLGLTYHFNRRGFTQVKPQDEKLLAELRSRIKEQQRELDNLKLYPPVIYKDKINEIKVDDGIANAVVFSISDYKVLPRQKPHIYPIAQYLINNNEANLTIIGYADAKTGTSKINKILSKKRALAVKVEIVKSYGIAEDRINVVVKGSEEQPFEINYWNRVVIMIAK